MDNIDDTMRDDAVKVFFSRNEDQIRDAGISLLVTSYFAGLTYVSNSISAEADDTSLVFSSLVFSMFSVYAAAKGVLPRVGELWSEYKLAKNQPKMYLSLVTQTED